MVASTIRMTYGFSPRLRVTHAFSRLVFASSTLGSIDHEASAPSKQSSMGQAHLSAIGQDELGYVREPQAVLGIRMEIPLDRIGGASLISPA